MRPFRFKFFLKPALNGFQILNNPCAFERRGLGVGDIKGQADQNGQDTKKSKKDFEFIATLKYDQLNIQTDDKISLYFNKLQKNISKEWWNYGDDFI